VVCHVLLISVTSASTIVNAVVVDDVFLLTCSKVGTTFAGHTATSILNMSVGMPSEDPFRSWRCVGALLRRDVRWTHVVSLTVGDFPLRPPDDVVRRLATTEDFDVSRRTGNDVVNCGAYNRSTVSRPSALRGDDSEARKWSSITTSEMRSPDGASTLEVCDRKCTIVDDDDSGGNNARCYYTVPIYRHLYVSGSCSPTPLT